MATSTYKAVGTYNDKALSQADLEKINAYKKQWEAANAKGDVAAMTAAHLGAEAIRAQYGYSGGADGSEYYATEIAAQPQYSKASITPAASADSYINKLYDAVQEANLNALKQAYDSSLLNLDNTASAIPKDYEAARNYTAAQSAVQKLAFNETAANRGLNTGAGSQALLSMDNTLNSNLSGLARAEADALSGIDLARQQLEAAYKSDIASAVSAGNLARAEALYNDFVRVSDSLVSAAKQQADEDYRSYLARYNTYETNLDALRKQASTLATYGDFSGYAKLGYPAETIALMQQAYLATLYQ